MTIITSNYFRTSDRVKEVSPVRVRVRVRVQAGLHTHWAICRHTLSLAPEVGGGAYLPAREIWVKVVRVERPEQREH